MWILQILLVLLPGLAAALAVKCIYKKKWDPAEWMIHATTYSLGIFWLFNGFLIARGNGDFAWYYFSPGFLIKYALASFFLVTAIICAEKIREYADPKKVKNNKSQER